MGQAYPHTFTILPHTFTFLPNAPAGMSLEKQLEQTWGEQIRVGLAQGIDVRAVMERIIQKQEGGSADAGGTEHMMRWV